jgi:hypothetical protein
LSRRQFDSASGVSASPTIAMGCDNRDRAQNNLEIIQIFMLLSMMAGGFTSSILRISET